MLEPDSSQLVYEYRDSQALDHTTNRGLREALRELRILIALGFEDPVSQYKKRQP